MAAFRILRLNPALNTLSFVKILIAMCRIPENNSAAFPLHIVVMRIMCRRGFEMDFAELLLEDYKASLKYLSDHPKLQGIAQQNSFKHT